MHMPFDFELLNLTQQEASIAHKQLLN